ncbi:AraC family transcriptional regulator [Paenibacillus protaetiae]|uniref:AraC family transcriptional regulator n=1 Tax=Paenibacillus protaetiae TaxID=2509456 RepID=A0A4P6EUB5_9BACL|nr:AraC family transcriptional regulator [Paenibacillus protaetiae]QAY65229.1 AraC family transcriptional regulator [Paenibacillus protaetiae]
MSVFLYDAMREKPDALERLDLRFTWGGYEIRVLRFHLVHFHAGKIITAHKHDEFEFHFIPRGKGKVTVEEQTYKLREGMFYLTGPGVVHAQEADSVEAMDELCLHVDILPLKTDLNVADSLEKMEADECINRLKQLPKYPVMDVNHAMPCFLQAYEACMDNKVGSFTTIKHSLVQILLRSVLSYDTGDNGASIAGLPARDMKQYRYKLALQFMRANYAGTLTLEDLADRLNISSRQLQRILKDRHPDKTFSTLLEDIRLEAVCSRLARTTDSIEEIALSEGFSSGNYLHLVFRKRLGITPNQYRLKHAAEEQMQWD